MRKDQAPTIRFDAKLIELHRLIAAGDFPSSAQIAAKFEVSTRTISRHIDLLRNLGAPVEYVAKKRGWHFKDPFWQLPPMKISEGDLLAFFVAEQSLRFTGQNEFAARLRTSLARLATLLPEHVSISLAELSAGVSFQSMPFAEVDPLTLEMITRAAIEQQVIQFEYYSPHSQKRSTRSVHVYLLHNFAGDWFAASFDPDVQALRHFHIARMSKIRLLPEYFEKDKSLDVAEYIRSGFLMMQGGKETEVRLVFDAYQSQWIRERTFFHADEIREEIGDGRLRLSFKIGDQALDAVARFCLGYADHCIIESPPKLKEMLKIRLKNAMELIK